MAELDLLPDAGALLLIWCQPDTTRLAGPLLDYRDGRAALLATDRLVGGEVGGWELRRGLLALSFHGLLLRVRALELLDGRGLLGIPGGHLALVGALQL